MQSLVVWSEASGYTHRGRGDCKITSSRHLVISSHTRVGKRKKKLFVEEEENSCDTENYEIDVLIMGMTVLGHRVENITSLYHRLNWN